MKPVELLEILHTAERLKDVTRHSYTSGGRHESVAEHSWRITLMAFLLRDEFPELDMDKVLRMCLIHDLGECFTGDIPAFDKTADDSAREEELLGAWVAQLPQPVRGEMAELYAEMEALGTQEARVYKCLDKLEAVIQHNESPACAGRSCARRRRKSRVANKLTGRMDRQSGAAPRSACALWGHGGLR